MSNDLSNQKTNADIVVTTEKLGQKQLWVSIISIGVMSLLGTLFLIEGNIGLGVSLWVAAVFIWWTLR